MAAHVLNRQFIRDAAGNPIGVILPLEEFALVEEVLKQRLEVPSTEDKLSKMKKAANDSLFMDDLREAMIAFEEADAEMAEPC
ncbi:MAG: hypothetical protein PHN61_07550 [Methanothrix sp.]|nr:hypothetical protein [Methanothrix sp.]